MVKKRKDREDRSDDGVTHGSPLKKNKVFCGLSKKIQLKYVKEKINDTTTHTHTHGRTLLHRRVEDVSEFRNVFEDVVRFAMENRNTSVEDVFTKSSVDYWTFNSSHVIFRFRTSEVLNGAVFDLVKNRVTVEILDGGEFLPLDDEDEDIAVELQSEIEQSEW